VILYLTDNLVLPDLDWNVKTRRKLENRRSCVRAPEDCMILCSYHILHEVSIFLTFGFLYSERCSSRSSRCGWRGWSCLHGAASSSSSLRWSCSTQLSSVTVGMWRPGNARSPWAPINKDRVELVTWISDSFGSVTVASAATTWGLTTWWLTRYHTWV
jgi:hypothetical protein